MGKWSEEVKAGIGFVLFLLTALAQFSAMLEERPGWTVGAILLGIVLTTPWVWRMVRAETVRKNTIGYRREVRGDRKIAGISSKGLAIGVSWAVISAGALLWGTVHWGHVYIARNNAANTPQMPIVLDPSAYVFPSVADSLISVHDVVIAEDLAATEYPGDTLIAMLLHENARTEGEAVKLIGFCHTTMPVTFSTEGTELRKLSVDHTYYDLKLVADGVEHCEYYPRSEVHQAISLASGEDVPITLVTTGAETFGGIDVLVRAGDVRQRLVVMRNHSPL